jgi:hypothetical protein
MQHRFLKNPPQVHELVWLVSLAHRSASWLYSMPAGDGDPKIRQASDGAWPRTGQEGGPVSGHGLAGFCDGYRADETASF